MGNHNHESCCGHENVEYCKNCKVAFCVDCGKEWGERYNWNYTIYPNYPYTAPTPIWGNITTFTAHNCAGLELE